MKNILFIFFVLIFSFAGLISSQSDLLTRVMISSKNQKLHSAAEKNNESLFIILLLNQSPAQKKETILFAEKMNGMKVSCLNDENKDNKDEINSLLSCFIDPIEIKDTMSCYRFEITNMEVADRFAEALKFYDGSNRTNDLKYFNTIKDFAWVKRINTSQNPNFVTWRSPLSFAMTSGNYHAMKLLLETTDGKAADYLQENECYYDKNIFSIGLTCTEAIVDLLVSYKLFSLLKQVYLHGFIYKYVDNYTIPLVMKKILTENIVDINEPMSDGTVPLIYVLQPKYAPMAGVFLNLHTINVDCVDKNGDTSLHLAVKMVFKPAVLWYVKNAYIEVDSCNVSILKKLLEKKANVMAQDADNNTVLHKALLFAISQPETQEGEHAFEFTKEIEYKKRKKVIDILTLDIKDEDLVVVNNAGQSISFLLQTFEEQFKHSIPDKTPEKITQNKVSSEHQQSTKETKKLLEKDVNRYKKKFFLRESFPQLFSVLILCAGMGFLLYNYLCHKQHALIS